MAKIATPFKVILSDGRELEGRSIPVDVVAAERQLGGLTDERRIQGTFYAAYNALRRGGHTFASFDEFLTLLEDYEELGKGEANGAAPSGEPVSPPSPTEPASPPQPSSVPVGTTTT